jgi:predicted dehydrogenase
MGTQLKVGLIGAGYLGKIHLTNWKEIEQVDLVGFFDPNPETAAAISQELSIPAFESGEQLIDACDAIDITAPTDHHLAWCEKAIRKGKHVFVEKPLAASLDEARKIVALTRESGVKLQVGHVERFNPAYLAIKDLSLQPLFIEVHRLAQFNPRGTEVSVILDLMIHDIDIILSIVKSDIKQISASGVAVLTDTPDIANVRIEFHNGCVANLTSSRISMKKMRKIRLFQKDAYIGIDFLDKKTEVIKLKGELEEENAFTFDIETHAGVKTISISSPEIPAVNAIQSELVSFRDAILHNTRTLVTETDGMLAMDVAHQILEKINQQLIGL